MATTITSPTTSASSSNDMNKNNSDVGLDGLKVSRKKADSELIVYDGKHRYELYFGDEETLSFSYPVPSGTRMSDLDYSFSGSSISCRFKKSSDPPFLEGKLWSNLPAGPDSAIVTFEESRTGRTLVIQFSLPKHAKWPILIGRPLNADDQSIDPWSAFLLGDTFEKGTASLPADPVQAFKYYENAARRGVAEAQYRLAQIYSNHIEAVLSGTAGQDNRLATMYYLAVAKVKAIGAHSKLTFAEIGDAQYHLGLAYQNGLGVAPHLETATKWYERARLNGNADAISKLEEGEDDDDSSNDSNASSNQKPTLTVVEKHSRPSSSISFWNAALIVGGIILIAGIAYEKYKGSQTPSD